MSTSAKHWLARLVLGAVVIGLLWLGPRAMPVDLALRFEVPPTLHAEGDRSLSRETSRRIQAAIRPADEDQGGEARPLAAPAASIDLALPGGIRGPLTAPVPLALPKGSWVARVRVQGEGGVVALRRVAFEATQDGPLRLPLSARPGPR